MNALYDSGRIALADGTINWATDDIKAVLVDATYTPDIATHQFLSDIPGGKRVATSPNLTGATINVPSTGVYDADDVTFVAVTGAAVAYLVLYMDTGSAGTSPLILVTDTAAGLPFTPTGTDRIIQWDNGSHRIFVTVTIGGAGLTVGAVPSPYTYLLADATDPASWWGSPALLHIFTWTPDLSGDVVLRGPAIERDLGTSDDNTDREYYVWAGTTVNVDYPDGTAASGSFAVDSLADAYSGMNGPGVPFSYSDVFHAVSGTTYTVAVVNWDDTPTPGQTVSLLEFYQSVQHLGGVAPLVPPATGAPIVYGSGGLNSGTLPTGLGLGAAAEGSSAAFGQRSHAEGRNSLTTGDYAHAEGFGSRASGQSSHAEGQSTAEAEWSHAEGTSHAFSAAQVSHAENAAQVTGQYAHGEGTSNVTANFAHGEGVGSLAGGIGAHAEGTSTQATGQSAHAEGTSTLAFGASSHTEGVGSGTNGIAAHAEGISTIAGGDYSHSEGKESYAFNILNCAHATAAGKIAGVGDAQFLRIPLEPVVTTNGTQTALHLCSGGAIAFVSLPDGAYQIGGRVVARRTDSIGTVSSWSFTGLVEVASSTARIVGATVTMEYQDANAATWGVDVDVHSGADLRVLVTGQAAKTIHWMAILEILLVT